MWHSVCLDRCSSFRRGCLDYVSWLACRSHNCNGGVGLAAAIGAGLVSYRCCVFKSLSRTMMQVPTRRLCIMIGSLRVDFIGYLCRSGVSAPVVSARAPVPSAYAALICAVDGSVVEERRGQPACVRAAPFRSCARVRPWPRSPVRGRTSDPLACLP